MNKIQQIEARLEKIEEWENRIFEWEYPETWHLILWLLDNIKNKLEKDYNKLL